MKPSSRISPHLELCCLRLSASLSYEQTQEEVEVQTGRRVSLKTQQRLVHRQQFDVPSVDEVVTQMSLDGGMIRLRTPNGQSCEWREYKALNLAEFQQGTAWFKDNEALLEWANGLPLAELVECLADGHDGVWGTYEHIGESEQRHEILDWFHLMENLHKLPESNECLQDARELLWYELPTRILGSKEIREAHELLNEDYFSAIAIATGQELAHQQGIQPSQVEPEQYVEEVLSELTL